MRRIPKQFTLDARRLTVPGAHVAMIAPSFGDPRPHGPAQELAIGAIDAGARASVRFTSGERSSLEFDRRSATQGKGRRAKNDAQGEA